MCAFGSTKEAASFVPSVNTAHESVNRERTAPPFRRLPPIGRLRGVPFRARRFTGARTVRQTPITIDVVSKREAAHTGGFFGERVAARYDDASWSMFDPAVIGPAVETLGEMAGAGAARDFAIGTGRSALPLAERGVRVVGIDASEAMLARLREKPGAEKVTAF